MLHVTIPQAKNSTGDATMSMALRFVAGRALSGTAKKLAGRFCSALLLIALLFSTLPPAETTALAAGVIRGVGTLGYGSPAAPAPPRPSYGGAPGDYARGHEGMTNTGDPWHRESDFKARNYQTRHGSQPAYASPPAMHDPAGVSPSALPSMPRPPLPGDNPAQRPPEGRRPLQYSDPGLTSTQSAPPSDPMVTRLPERTSGGNMRLDSTW